ncbi:hypothetical protein AQUCO_05600038v1 [Aquilegia coerulea]|uniref:Sieve element occlusion N-terminal domain-containing protein n=1 Tax=Aquilegia coerulea TaxID=218851 RepID=A0A2G5CGD1_AQUCA|nr:hypothetical protein AQUCO_05600038v1 [Aquilegia coerulea]
MNNTKPTSRLSMQTLEQPRTMNRLPMQTLEPKTTTGSPMQSFEPKAAQTTLEPKATTELPKQLLEPKTMTGFPMQRVDPMLQLMRSDRHLFSSSDTSMMMRQIQATHVPDGREVDVRPLLHVIEDIVQRSTPNVLGVGHVNATTQSHFDVFEDKTHQDGFMGILEAVAYTIHRISCEVSSKCLDGADAHTTTLSLLNMLSSFSWDAKVVLALAAFAVNYGEFWLLVQLYPTDHLAKSIMLLKQLPDVLEHNESLRSLVKAMLDLTKCIVELSQLPAHYITPDVSAMSVATTQVPTAAYWTIKSVVACMSHMISLIGFSHHEYASSTNDAWELSSLTHKVNSIHELLTKQLSLCYQYIEEKRHVEAYQTLVRLFETLHIDNIKILKALFYTKDDLPLVDGFTKRRVSIDVLRRKNVLLLISDLSIPQEELSILEQLYRESRNVPSRPESQYEVVWLPVVDRVTPWNEAMQQQFESMQLQMPWHTVYQPTAIDPAVIRYIKEVWHFVKKPLLVVLDPQGRVVCPNALPMMWIWGIAAFPFTSAREEALWKEESWRLELLVNGIDATLLTWIPEGRYICLYGGEDIGWIRKFTTMARAAARIAGVPLEMVYVGKSNPREKVRRVNEIIAAEKLSHYWPDLTSIWFFWVRLESMMYSKMQLGKTVEKDPILQEIMRMLGYDSTNQGWAIIARGATGIPELARGNGEMMLTSFAQFDEWKEHVEPKGFIPALNDHLQHIQTPHHCTHLKLPGNVGRIMDTVVCAECGRLMEKFFMYECCTE